MGLLDSMMGDPEQMGLLSGAAGMADASGPSLMPRSFGQVMAAGLRGSQAGYNAAQDQQMRQLEMMSKKVGLQQAMAKLGYIQQLTQDGSGQSAESQPAIAAPQASSMPLGSGFTGMAPAQPSDGQQTVAPRSGTPNMRAMMGLALMDGKIGDAYGMQKDMITGFERKAGSFYTRSDGTQEYLPNVKDGLTIGANGQVMELPNFSNVNAGIEGAKTNAVEQAKNQNTLLPLDYVGADNERIGGTVYDQIQRQRNLAASGPMPTTTQQPAPSQDAAPAWKAGKFAPDVLKNLQNLALQGNPDAMQMLKAYTQRGQAQQMQTAQQAPAASTMAYSPQGGSGLQSPAQAQAIKDQQEVAKADALKQVNLNNDPNIKFKTDLLSTAHAANAATLTKLSDTVRSEFELQNRNKQLLPMLDKIQTGGFNPEGRIQFANALQTSGMVPDAAKKPLGEFLASGDPTTGKVLENQLAAAGIKTMLDTLDKEGKPNRAIFDAIHDAQESVKSGNGTLKQVFALQKQLYDMHYQQEQDMGKAMAAPDYNPLTMQTAFSKQRNESLSTPALTASKAPDSVAPPKQAVNMLRMNPKLAVQFDSKYGAGAAAQILGK